MVHRVSKIKLKRPNNQRDLLVKNLFKSLLKHEKIVTTSAKSRALKRYADSELVKLSKVGKVERETYLKNLFPRTSKNILETLSYLDKDRTSYVSNLKLGNRPGDNAAKVLLMIKKD